VLPHAGWWNFTAVTGGLIYFGAKRPWREMFIPLAALIATDCFLTIGVYHYTFHWQGYVFNWAAQLATIGLGAILLSKRMTFARGAGGAVLGPTLFFVVSNFGVWAGGMNLYPHSLAGLVACYAAAIPFYGNDLLATSVVLGVALGVPALVRRMNASRIATVSGA
jgi:hypothetical protein